MIRISELYTSVETLVGERAFRILRYLFSGGTAAATNVFLLFLLVHFTKIYYLYASIIAFVASIAVSFTLQKFLTFRDMPVHDVHKQFTRYLVIIGCNLILNTVLMYIFVDYFGVWYVSSQVVVTAIIAVIGYFGYRHFVFRERS